MIYYRQNPTHFIFRGLTASHVKKVPVFQCGLQSPSVSTDSELRMPKFLSTRLFLTRNLRSYLLRKRNAKRDRRIRGRHEKMKQLSLCTSQRIAFE